MDICLKHVREAPESPSVRLGKPITRGLETLVLRCLSKARADRPGDAGALLRELEKCPVAGAWTADDAAAWWAARENAPSTPVAPAATTDRAALAVTGAYESP
jgi:hypothetical protein